MSRRMYEGAKESFGAQVLKVNLHERREGTLKCHNDSHCVLLNQGY